MGQGRDALERRRVGGGGSERGGGGSTLLLDNCSLKGFDSRIFFWPVLLVGCGWLLLIPGALWVVAIIQPQVALETVNLKKNFQDPDSGFHCIGIGGGGGGGSERGGGGLLLPFFWF